MSTTTPQPTDYTLLATHAVSDPAKMAVSFQVMLATEKGYTSTIVRTGKAIDVVASDNRAVRFVKKA